MRRHRFPLDNRGFALVIVLWIAGLLAVLAATLAVSVRTHVRVTENVVESAKAEALADAGIALGMIDLMAARRNAGHQRRFPVKGQSVFCTMSDAGALLISISDEAARVDVNSAGVPLLQALIAGTGETPETAAQLADAIFDFRDSDDDRQPNGAESADYRSAGLDWTPKNSRLKSVDELGQVLGMTPDILTKLRPHIGVHSGLPGLDARSANNELIAILRSGLQSGAGAFGGFPQMHREVALPQTFISASPQRFYALRVQARTPSGAFFVRNAVADLGARSNADHVFLRWDQGTARLHSFKNTDVIGAPGEC
jgi:general secretion pathway protein K